MLIKFRCEISHRIEIEEVEEMKGEFDDTQFLGKEGNSIDRVKLYISFFLRFKYVSELDSVFLAIARLFYRSYGIQGNTEAT